MSSLATSTESSVTGTAVVFPGMGPGSFDSVGKFMLINPFARRLLAQADEVLGYRIVDRYRETSGDYSEYAQVAFLVNCLALAEWAEQHLDVEPGLCVGPSFGGKAAAIYSGALGFAEGVAMTAAWARALDEYFAVEHVDVVTHSFVRVPREVLDIVRAELDELGEWHDIACYIDDDFHMLSLRRDRLEWLQQRLRAAGGLSLYTMHPPMHSSAFGALRDKMADEVIGGLTFSDPRLPVVADQDGSLLTTGEQVRGMLLDGFVRPVRWPDVVRSLRREGVETVYVCGQDNMFGRVPCTTKSFEVVAVNPRLAMQPRKRSLAG